MAQRAGLSKIWVKDESKRFNLNAFKVLGASFAFAKYILGSREPLEYEDVVSKVQKVGMFIFVQIPNNVVFFRIHSWSPPLTAIMAMGWRTLLNFSNAKQKYKSRISRNCLMVTTLQILMPEGTVPARAERIRKLGAECDVLDVRNKKPGLLE